MNTNSGFKINKPTLLLGICGANFSGKSTICKKISESLGENYKNKIVCISQDNFRREVPSDKEDRFNYVHPDIIDENLMRDTLSDIIKKKKVKIPTFDIRTKKLCKGQQLIVHTADVVLVEGSFIFSFPEVRKLFGIKIFVDVSADITLARRMLHCEGKVDQELEHYLEFVKPMMEEYCLPAKRFADIIIPWNIEKKPIIDLLKSNISRIVHNKDTRLIEEFTKSNRCGS